MARPRLFCALGLLLFLSGIADAKALCLVTGNLKDLTGNGASNQRVDFANIDAPYLSGPTIFLPRAATTTTDAAGAFSINLTPGHYRMSVGGVPTLYFTVPSDADTFLINSVTPGVTSVFLTDLNSIYQLKLSTNDPSPGYLPDKLLAGRGIILSSTASNLTATVDETAMLLQSMGGLLDESQIRTNSKTAYGQVPQSGSATNGVYRTDENGNPYWGPIPSFGGTLTPSRIPYASGTNSLADSPISVTDTNSVSVPNLTVTGSLTLSGDPTKTNIMGGAGTIVSNWLSTPYITLGGETNQLSVSGGQLQLDGAPISGGPALTNGTASAAVVTDANTNLTTSATTATEIGYVHGVTSAIQTQLDAKQPASSVLTDVSNGNGSALTNAANWVASGSDSKLAGTASTYGLIVTNHISFVGTNGLLNLPVLTTAQKNALTATNGAMVYDSDLGRAQIYDGSAWHSRVRWDGDTNSSGLFEFGSLQLDGTLSLTNDVFLKRDAANTLALRNGANAQTFNIYNTYTDASNYERGGISWIPNTLYLYTQKAGTGTARDIRIGGDSATNVRFTPGNLAAWTMLNTGHLVSPSDNTYDIGASGATRPRTIYAATSIVAPRAISAKTTNYTASANEPRAVFTNTGASGEVDFTLPTWATGLEYTFDVEVAQILKIIAPGTDTIRIAGSVSAGGGNITASTIGNTITLVATASGKWVVISHEGTWTVN